MPSTPPAAAKPPERTTAPGRAVVPHCGRLWPFLPSGAACRAAAGRPAPPAQNRRQGPCTPASTRRHSKRPPPAPAASPPPESRPSTGRAAPSPGPASYRPRRRASTSLRPPRSPPEPALRPARGGPAPAARRSPNRTKRPAPSPGEFRATAGRSALPFFAAFVSSYTCSRAWAMSSIRS